MSTDRRYKITNNTIKAPRLDSKGRDMRPNRDKVGHGVSFDKEGVVGDERHVTLYAGKHAMVKELSESILTLHKRQLVTIEVVDMADEFKKFATKPEVPAVVHAPTPTPVKDPTPSMFGEATGLPPDIRAKSYPMGETREDVMVNPDGEPNFVAKATKDAAKKKGTKPATEPEEV